QSKRKLIAATALFLVVGTITAAIAMQGGATASFAQPISSETGGGGAQTGGGGTATEEEQAGVHHHQGTVTSEATPIPGLEDTESAMILPPEENGLIETGVITYASSEPIQVAVLNMQDLNATERQILNATDSPFGTIPTVQLDNETSVALSLIGEPATAGTVQFSGNAIMLHNADGTPFAATYSLDAEGHRPELMNSINNMTTAAAEEDGGGDEAAATDGGGGDEAAATDGGGGDEAAATDGGGGNQTATDGGGD
ncbi:MAG TPA: hypothetical protein VGE97_04225, partial [Nitrososphaera sp.]